MYQDTVIASEKELELDLETIITDQEAKQFMFMTILPGISRLNIVAMYANSFILTSILMIKSTLITYILVEDYNITQQDAGFVAGKLGFYGVFIVIPSEFLFGIL